MGALTLAGETVLSFRNEPQQKSLRFLFQRLQAGEVQP
jgi:hypothetical protein